MPSLWSFQSLGPDPWATALPAFGFWEIGVHADNNLHILLLKKILSIVFAHS